MTKHCMSNDTNNKDYSNTNLEHLPNRIADNMAERSILITGGAGFMGKVLVEKLLRERSCPKVKCLYLLLRPKKGKDPQERLEEVLKNPLFEQLRKGHGKEIFKKVVAIAGDVSTEGLGLSKSDRQILIDNVSIVYHCAASIRFDEPLKKAVLLNTRGTKLMLELAAEMKKLEVFFHVSTAYCHSDQKVLQEKTYDPPADPHKIIEFMEKADEEIDITMTKKLLGTLPNTYVFSKALGEGLVNEQMEKLPVVIMRPSVVIPIWKEPLPGWIDNINGPIGLLIGAGKGIIRTMYGKEEFHADFITVDVAVSCLIVAAWNYIANEDKETRVYNMTTSDELLVSWKEIIDMGRKVVTQKVPFDKVVWYPGGSMKNNRLVHNICVFFFHLLPAYFLDAIIFLAGYKPVLVRIQQRVSKGFEVFEYYVNNQWIFESNNIMQLRGKMNESERKEFEIEKAGFDLEEYIEACIHGARLYILKEMPENLPAARRHLKVMYWVDVITKIVLALLFAWFVIPSKMFIGTADLLVNFCNTFFISMGILTDG